VHIEKEETLTIKSEEEEEEKEVTTDQTILSL